MNIVVSYDGSEDVKEGIKHLPKFIEKPGDKVFLLHVIPKGEDIDREELKVLKEKAQNLLEEGKRLFSPEVNLETVVIEDYSVAEAILNFLEKVSADLLIMGARGIRPDILRYTLGSTTSKVTAFAPCSVYIARSKPKEE